MSFPAHIFREYDIRGVAERDLTSELVERTAHAFAATLASELGRAPLLALGRDGRLSSPRIHEAVLRGFAGAMMENVLAHSGLLGAALDFAAPALVVIVVPEGGDAGELRRALSGVSLPNAVVHAVAAGEGGTAALPASSPAHGKTAIDGKPTAYVCIGPQCSLPVTEPAKLVETIRAVRQVDAT